MRTNQCTGLVPMFAGLPLRRRQNITPVPRPFGISQMPFDAMAILGGLPNMAAFDAFKVDMKETDEDYQLVAEFPGVAKEDVDIDMEDGMLIISCEKKEEKSEEEDSKWLVRERSYSSSKRSFYLPDGDEEKTTANLEDGILTITVPKKIDESVSKKIEIS